MEKKLEEGDLTCAYDKEILGCIFNGRYYTQRLSADKIIKILKRLHNIKKFTTKTPRKFMENIADSLQHA